MTKTGKTALVTGASAGLGADFARLFAADGHDLVLVARRRDKLDALARELEAKHGTRVTVIAADLTRPEAPAEIVAQLADTEIEFLVNNAGLGTTGAFAASDVSRELGMLALNITALVHLTRLLLPAMVARKSGRILNIGSTAGFLPGPFMAGYYASKAFVNSFTEALSFELRGTGVTATVACPGATETEFAAVAGVQKSKLFAAGTMGSAEVAAASYRAMLDGTPVVVTGVQNKLKIFSLRFAPRSLVASMAASLNRPGA